MNLSDHGRHAAFGRWLKGLGVFALIGAFALLLTIPIWKLVHPLNKYPLEMAVYPSIILFLSSLFLFGLSKRMLRPYAKALIESDARKHVLLLRPFAEDERSVWSEFMYGERYEEVLAGVLGHIGPVIAVGRPGERLNPSGASRLYVQDEEWQETVSRLMSSARLVVLFLFSSSTKKNRAASGGFTWEIDQACKVLQPQQLLLMLPRGASILKTRGYYELLYTKRKSKSYLRASKGYLDRLNQLLPRPLPPAASEADYIFFSHEWSPRLLRAGKFQTLAYTLKPLFQNLGLKPPKQNYWYFLHEPKTIMMVVYLLVFGLVTFLAGFLNK
jgi:hypothetical protein